MITVVVQGGPDGLEQVRRIAAEEVPERLVVPFYGCHQHFERTAQTVRVEGERVPVFRFSYSTAIAE